MSAQLPDAYVTWLAGRRQAGDDGKTLLIGLRAGQPVFAVAAGLRDAADEPRFLQFGRYLLHHRFRCDGHCVMLPALAAGQAVYLIEYAASGQPSRSVCTADRELHAFGGDILAIGDWSRPGPALPGVLRRDLDALYEAVRIDLPGVPG